MAKVTIYTLSFCPHCKKAKALLDNKGVAYEEIEISDNEPQMRSMLLEKAGKSSVPQIFIDEKPVGGNSDLQELNASGELDKMLKE